MCFLYLEGVIRLRTVGGTKANIHFRWRPRQLKCLHTKRALFTFEAGIVRWPRDIFYNKGTESGRIWDGKIGILWNGKHRVRSLVQSCDNPTVQAIVQQMLSTLHKGSCVLCKLAPKKSTSAVYYLSKSLMYVLVLILLGLLVLLVIL